MFFNMLCAYPSSFFLVPEMLYEISKSKFVVVDITFPNYGAYYEAGYAEALGLVSVMRFSRERNSRHYCQ